MDYPVQSQFQPAQQPTQPVPKPQLVRGTHGTSAQTYSGKDRSCQMPKGHVRRPKRRHRRGHMKIQEEGHRRGHFEGHQGRCTWRKHCLPEDWSPWISLCQCGYAHEGTVACGGPHTRAEQSEQVNV